MEDHDRVLRTFKQAAVATTLTAIAVAVTALPSFATPERASAEVVDGVLVVNGTNDADRITVDFSPGNAVAVNLGDGSAAHRFDRATFRSASVSLHAGDDDFRAITGGSATTDVPLTVHAGAGDDFVLGGAANDVLYGGFGEDEVLGGAGTDLVFGGRGADEVNGGVGTDTEVLGPGDDTAAWNPGEGNDTIDGGSGRDTLAFNGSDGDERMSLTANGQSAVFLRSLGSIRMDLVGVERLDLAALGGTDNVTVGDLSGTDVDEADIDLGAADGSGDHKTDAVVVDGTDAADGVDVTASGSTVDVNGLRTVTRISGGETTDHLEVDAAGGNDRVDVSDAARALLAIAVDLGAGQLL